MKRLRHDCQCGRLHVHCDGQPFKIGPGIWDGYATVVLEDGTPKGTLFAYKGVGNRTSNECEYSAVILSLEWARVRRERVHIITDSNLILGHLERGDRCTQHLIPYRDRVRALLKEVDARVTWMGRDYNLAGWHNAEVLLERVRDKRQRERANRPVRHHRAKPTKEQQVERRRMAYAERDGDD